MPHGKNWSEDELEFIRYNQGKMNYTEMSAILGRTRAAIAHKARRMDLEKVFPERLREDGLVLCTRCNEYLEPENFHRNTQSKIGYYSHCKPCASLTQRLARRQKIIDAEVQSKEQWIEERKDRLYLCKGCNTEKKITEFTVWKRTNNGKYDRRAKCHKCAVRIGKEKEIEKWRKNEYVEISTKS